MSADDVRFERDDGVAVITLNRPERSNTLTDEMLELLQGIVSEIEDDESIGAVVLTGAGATFCGGFDLTGGAPRSGRHAFRAHADLASNTLWRIRKSRLPFVAAVRGACIGGAVYLTGVCDFMLTTAEARIGMVELKFGMAPPLFNIFPWLLSDRHAREFLLTGDAINGNRAVEIGLATRVVADEQLMDEAMALARRLANMPDGVVSIMKQAINHRWELAGFVAGLEHGVDGFVDNKVNMGPVQSEYRRLSREIGSRAALDRLGIDLGIS